MTGKILLIILLCTWTIPTFAMPVATLTRNCQNILAGVSRLVLSRIHLDQRLVRLAEEAGQDARVQREGNLLIERLQNGQLNLGMGRFALGNGYFEIRGAHGARIITKENADTIIIVGKSSKKVSGNERRMFEVLRDLYPDFPSSRGGNQH